MERVRDEKPGASPPRPPGHRPELPVTLETEIPYARNRNPLRWKSSPPALETGTVHED